MSTFKKFWLKSGIDLLSLNTINPGKMEAGLNLEQLGACARFAVLDSIYRVIGAGFNCVYVGDSEASLTNGGYDFNVKGFADLPADASGDTPFIYPTPMYDLDLENTTTADLSESGAGGLDTGVEAVSTLYYLYAIANSDYPGVVNLIWSIESDADDVTFPDGYDQICPITFAFNDSGSDLEPFETYILEGGDRRYIYSNTPSILSAGEADQWTEVGIASGLIPDWSIEGVWVNASTSDGTSAFELSNNLSAAFCTTIDTYQPMVFIPSTDGTIYYQRTAGGGNLTLQIVAIDYVAFKPVG